MRPRGAEGAEDALTYAIYPYLPDTDHYQQLIEQRWAEAEPDVPLARVAWDCYDGTAPEGIDVVMYDAVLLDALIGNGWIRLVDPADVRDSGDIYPYALEGLTVGGELYGIPVFLCGNYLIYDRDCAALAEAEHITDLDGAEGLLLMSSDDPTDRAAFLQEALADSPDPSADGGADGIMALIDRLAVEAHKKDHSKDLALAYEAGAADGYISYTETMSYLDSRMPQTDVKPISFGSGEDTPRVFVDAVAMTAGVDGDRYALCAELMNIIAGADVLEALSAHDGRPQYLLLARRSPYASLAGQFPLYARLEELAANEDNQVILAQ